MIMTPHLRNFTLIAHIVFSVGWIGAIAAYLVLDIAVVISKNDQTLRAAYIAMDLIISSAIVPLAFASLLTGLVVSLGTKWGLFRNYWVIAKLLLTVFATIILLIETQTISYMANIAADPTTSSDDLVALGSTLVHSIGGLVVLLLTMILSVYKPRGMTRYGWRKQQEQRKVSQL